MAAFATLFLLGGVVPLAIAHHFGAFGIPRNGDDWSYLTTLFRFADHGRIDGNGWASMNLVGQVVIAAPPIVVLGHRVGVAQTVVVALGVAGLVALYDIARRVTSPRRALFVAAVVATGPMWATYAVSFMTDVPFFALMAICLAVGCRAAGEGDVRRPLLLLSLAVGFVAFTVREYAVVAPVAVILVAVWLDLYRDRRRAVIDAALLVALVGAVAGFELWRRSLPGFTDLAPHWPTAATERMAFDAAVGLAASAGLAISPVVVLAGPWRMIRRAWSASRVLTVALSAGLGLCLVIGLQRNAPPRSYFWVPFLMPVRQAGASGSDLVPAPVMFVLALIGSLALITVLVSTVPSLSTAARRVAARDLRPGPRPEVTMIALTAIGLAVLYVAALLGGLPVWDRYILPLVPLLAVVAIARAGPSSAAPWRQPRVLGAAAMALSVAAFGLVYSMAAAARDGTGWRTAAQVEPLAHDPLRINLSGEWQDWHAGRGLASQPSCIVIHNERLPIADGARVVAVRRLWTPWGPPAAMVARQTAPC